MKTPIRPIRMFEIFCNTAKGVSEFRPLNPGPYKSLELGNYSRELPAKSFQIRYSEAGLHFPEHTAPRRQYIVYLDSAAKIKASGGEEKIFESGDILFATDTEGAGHSSTIIKSGHAIIIPAADEAQQPESPKSKPKL